MEHKIKLNNNINERKHVKCSGLSLWKKLSRKLYKFQGLMATPGMIQTPWYSNDHVSNYNLSETTQSLSIFAESYAQLNEKNRKLKRLSILAKISKRITSDHVELHRKKRLQYPKFWLRGGQRLKLRHDLDGCPLHFWPAEGRDGTVNLFYATCTRCKKKKTSKPSLDTLWLFLLQIQRTNACSRGGQTRSQDSGNQVTFTTCSF